MSEADNIKQPSGFPDLSGQVVLITGGTRGIGLETGLSFGKRGARCILTYRWGDHSEDDILEAFEDVNAPAPIIAQANVADKADTQKLMERLSSQIQGVDVFICNVSVSAIVRGFEDYSLKALKQSISYSSWPMVSYTLKLKEAFNRYPKYIMGISSTGPDHYSYGYDFVAASKTVMEVMVRYLNYRLREEGVVINAIRSRAIKTKSLVDTFGGEMETFMKRFVPENYWIEPAELAEAIVALCSGYCDAISGQTLNVDRGTSFFDNLMDIYTRHLKTKT